MIIKHLIKQIPNKAGFKFDQIIASPSKLSGKNKKILNKLINTFEMENGDNIMIKNALLIWKRLHKSIKHLSAKEQFEIIYKSLMIAYDARISGFNQIYDNNPNKKMHEDWNLLEIEN